MWTAIGLVLVVFGGVSIWAGDKVIPVKGGVILRLFSPTSPLAAKWFKWAAGLGAIWGGGLILFKLWWPF